MECRRKGKLFIAYLIGVAIFHKVAADQSALATPDDDIGEENVRERQKETPEVVLQLKYDNGELNKIYLAQFRKPASVWLPSVSDRTVLCTDLCHAGLGGPVCGATCPQMLPVGLKLALTNNNVTEVEYGQPRVGVCPTLCDNYLGIPLCPCKKAEDNSDKVTDWNSVCDAFCTDGYLLPGCPVCTSPPSVAVSYSTSRILTTSEGWSAWCDVQCRQGHGGAACNCDRTPF